MKNSNQHGRGPGASIYLTQHEMEVILEAIALMRDSYSEGAIFDQIKFETETITDKLRRKWVP